MDFQKDVMHIGNQMYPFICRVELDSENVFVVDEEVMSNEDDLMHVLSSQLTEPVMLRTA